jgi:Glycosyl transferase family 2
MRFLKQSTRKAPRLSLILLDWSVRESFHLLHYLRHQSIDRDQFEVIFIEYYSRIAEPLKQFADQLDTWVLLEMPETCIYHKHLMYNCGLALAHGDVVVLCDSDAMVMDSFVETILGHFKDRQQIVLHLDQFRNTRRDLYPFKYPSFDEVLGDGCANNVDGKTAGIVDRIDPLHSRNYGACMCARRADLIAIGGADEHIDYLGHICGPYEMTFRLLNKGFKEIWDETEYLYHTWHPGQAGVDNYQGPHDGRQLSSTALTALMTGRVFPLVENEVIRLIKQREPMGEVFVQESLIDERYLRAWYISRIAAQRCIRADGTFTDIYRGITIIKDEGDFYARTLFDTHVSPSANATDRQILRGKSVENLAQQIDEHYPRFLQLNERIARFYSRVYLLIWAMVAPLIGLAKIILIRLSRGDRAAARILIAPQLSGRSWHSSLSRSWEKYRVGWLAVKHYRGYVDEGANHLIASLYFAKPGMLLPIVLTTSPFVQIYLTGLSALRVVPPLKVKRLKNRAKIQRYFDHLCHDDHPQTLIVARDIYTNYYGVVQTCRDLKQFIVA